MSETLTPPEAPPKETALSEPPPDQQQGETPWAEIVKIVVFGFLALGPTIAAIFGVGKPKLEIAIAAEPVPGKSWTLTGRVLYNGSPAADPEIWAVAHDDRGNRFSPTQVLKTNAGGFEIPGIPYALGGTNGRMMEVTVYGKVQIEKVEKEWWSSKTNKVTVTGKEILSLGQGGGVRWIQLPRLETITIPCVFVASLFLAILPAGANRAGLKLKYFGLVFLAFLLTAMMVYSLSKGLKAVNSTPSAEILSLGFANIHCNTYVKGVTDEWLFSLTSPSTLKRQTQTPTPSDDLATGFGAPLWVLLVAVLGAGILTVSIIVKGINDPLTFQDPAPVSKRVEEIVRHQFYILFAPLGAIFIYQFLVVAGAASQNATVAVAALAAGASLNFLLDKAVNKMQQLMTK